MKKTTKLWLVIAASLVLVGCIMFGSVMQVFQWDFTKLQVGKCETNEYIVDEDYKNILIVTKTADIVIAPSESKKHSVLCYEQKNMKHSVSVKEGTLSIEVIDTRKWYEYLEIAFKKPSLTVYIPQEEYGALTIQTNTGHVAIAKEFQFERIDISENTGNVTVNASALDAVKIKTSTGSICVENSLTGALELSASTGAITVSDVICGGDANINVSTGTISLNNVGCKNLMSSGNTGDISLHNVIATEKLSIKRSTGDVKIDSSDAAEIFIETDTGDVTGNLLTEKVFIAHTDTGTVDVPKTVKGGRCEISTDTGNIILKIHGI